MKKMLVGLILIALALSFFPERSWAAPQVQDPSFQAGGKYLTTIGSQDISGQSVMVQPDQKLLVAASVFDGDWDYAVLRYCPDGSLDDGVNCGAPGFGTGGRVVTDFGNGFHDYVMDAVLQPDGKIILAGTSSSYPQFDMAVARYNPNGTLDTTFDGDGLVKVDFQNSDERVNAVALQPDGKIILGGVSYISGGGDFALVRLCPNGSLDDGVNCGETAFGDSGKVTTDYSGFSDYISAVAVHDGKIIAGGSGGDRDFAVARYTTNGALDTTFDSDGKKTVSFGEGWDYGQDLVVQSDGKIILAGGGYVSEWNHDFGLVRFNTNGTLDANFGVSGKVLTEFAGYSDRVLSVTLDGEMIIAAGYAGHCFGNDIAVARYNSLGILDSTFDSDGKVTTEYGGNNDSSSSVAVQGDGKIVIAGHAGDYSGGSGIALARYTTNGSLDITFDGDGKVTTGSVQSADLGVGVTSIESSIFVTGWTNNGTNHDFTVAKFTDQGTLDVLFSSDGFAKADFKAGDDLGTSIAAQPDGKIVVAGTTYQGNNGDFALARFDEDGTLDDEFGVDGRVITDFGGNEIVKGLVILPDEDIVVVGSSRVCPDSSFAIARYDSDGSPDMDFDLDGKLIVDFVGRWDEAAAVAVQEDGKIIVVGGTHTTGSDGDFALVRLCPDGNLDDGTVCGSLAFGAGIIMTNFAGDTDRATAVIVQGDGKIVVAGASYAGRTYFALARYCPDGKLDNGINCGSTAFGVGGKKLTSFLDDWNSLYAMILLPDGKLMACGASAYDGWDQDFIVALFDQDGSLDTSFSQDGWDTVDFGDMDEICEAMALKADGKIVLAGQSGRSLAMIQYLLLDKYIYLPLVVR